MLKMSEYSNVLHISFLVKPRSYLVGYHRVSYQYTPSSSHDPVLDFSPLVRGFTWNDPTHSIISLLELIIQHVLCAKDSAQHDTFCGNAYWRKPYSRGFDSLSNEYSFREDKSKLKE